MMKLDNSVALMKAGSLPKIDKNENDTKLKEQTDKFEALFIKEVLDTSIKPENSLFPKSAGEKIYQSMYNEAMSNSLSGHFGFSELLFNYLKEKG